MEQVESKLLLFLHPLERNELPYGVLNEYPNNQMVNNVFIDKIDPYHCKLIVPSLDQILNHKINGKTFEEIAFERADYFNKLDQKIFLKYSGGTDSSVALLAMLRSWDKEDIKKLHLIMTEKSVEEFPELWPELKETFAGRIYDANEPMKQFHNMGTLVNGECGDQLFGSSLLARIVHNFGVEAFHRKWQDYMPQIYIKMFKGDQAQASLFMRRYFETTKKSPIPIKSVFDWVWWFNYTNKVQHVLLRDLAYEPELTDTYHEKHLPFFYTIDFFRWSIDNHDKKIKGTFRSYKHTAKNFIQKHSGFTGQWKRLKVGSRVFLWEPGIERKRFEYATPLSEIKAKKTFMAAIDQNMNYMTITEAQKFVRTAYPDF
jgi:hypothetical protein